jgi:hypothetical protein
MATRTLPNKEEVLPNTPLRLTMATRTAPRLRSSSLMRWLPTADGFRPPGEATFPFQHGQLNA